MVSCVTDDTIHDVCSRTQLAYQMREARLAKSTIAELQRQLDEERENQMQIEKKRSLQLSDEIVTAMRLLTDKVTLCDVYYLLTMIKL